MTIEPYWTPLPGINAKTWRAAAAAKKAAQAKLIPTEWQIDAQQFSTLLDVTDVPQKLLSSRELEITEIDDAYELQAKLLNKSFSATEVAKAMCHRASIAHQLTNCLTEIFFDRALKTAAELDELLAKTGKPKGPLHGIPISLKDQFDIEGIECTIGYSAYIGRISPESCALVKLLEDAGAVLYARTTVPQTLMRPDTLSHVFGATLNPKNRKLSAGGSSGGEGALIAMKGSILGLGTDIGGSLRIPAALCGIATLKPSIHRVPYGKATNSMLGQTSMPSVIGPMARSLDSCKLLLSAVCALDASRYDATAIPLPFNETLYEEVSAKKVLTFGYLKNDGFVTPTPPLSRALEEAIVKLKAAGHEVIEFDGREFLRAGPIAGEYFAADGVEDINNILAPMEEEPLHVVENKPAMSVYENWQLNREKEALQQAFLEHWKATKKLTSDGQEIDALLSIAVPVPAGIPGDLQWCGYTMMFNALDLPCTVFPVTQVDARVDVKPANFKPMSHWDLDVYTKYDPVVCDGMPVTLQIVGLRWKEEAVLAASVRVEKILRPT